MKFVTFYQDMEVEIHLLFISWSFCFYDFNLSIQFKWITLITFEHCDLQQLFFVIFLLSQIDSQPWMKYLDAPIYLMETTWIC